MAISLQVYDHFRWLNVKQRLMVNDPVMMHKCLKGLSPSYLPDKFSTRALIYDRQTRIRDSFNIPSLCLLNSLQSNIFYRIRTLIISVL